MSDFNTMTVTTLRILLKERQLDTKGLKSELVDRLELYTVQQEAQEAQEASNDVTLNKDVSDTDETNEKETPGSTPTGTQKSSKRRVPDVDETENPPRKRQASVDGASKIAFKFTLNNNDAGSVIGKGGTTIGEMKAVSGADIRISQHREYFPQTELRVVLTKGTAEQIKSAYSLIVARRFEVFKASLESEQKLPEPQQMKIIIPGSACGVLIGTKGENVQRIMRESGSRIQVANKDPRMNWIGERMVTITGNEEALTQAGCLIVKLIFEDDKNIHAYRNTSTKYSSRSNINSGYGMDYPFGSYESEQYYETPYGGGNFRRPFNPSQSRSPRHTYAQKNAGTDTSKGEQTTLSMQCADSTVGSIVGKRGVIIKSLMQASGARIQISQKDDYVPGTSNRRITITGSAQACEAARKLVQERIDGPNDKQSGAYNGSAPKSYYGGYSNVGRYASGYSNEGAYGARGPYGATHMGGQQHAYGDPNYSAHMGGQPMNYPGY